MPAGAAARMQRVGFDERSDVMQRLAERPVAATVGQGLPARRVVRFQDHPHRRGLPGPVGAQEPRDNSGPDLEREVVDRDQVAESLGQTPYLDHRVSVGVVVGDVCVS